MNASSQSNRRPARTPGDWFETLDDRVWLSPDEMGAEEARFIRRALRLRKGDAVLDAPCGPGRIAFHLARTGCRVTGVDIRPQFVERARRRFREFSLAGDFHVMDLRKLHFSGQFDAIFNWSGSFGYFSDAENAELVRRYAAALRQGGRLLIEQFNRERILRHFIAERVDDGIVTRNRWDRRTQRSIQRRIIGGVEDTRSISSVRWYTPKQMKDLFVQAGLLVEGILGFPDGSQFGRSSGRMVTIGRKP
jgi:SAM-dependent methyltransferase